MTGPRIGPTRVGDTTVWARLIAGRHWTFIATPDGIAVRPADGPNAHQLTHHYTPETT